MRAKHNFYYMGNRDKPMLKNKHRQTHGVKGDVNIVSETCRMVDFGVAKQ